MSEVQYDAITDMVIIKQKDVQEALLKWLKAEHGSLAMKQTVGSSTDLQVSWRGRIIGRKVSGAGGDINSSSLHIEVGVWRDYSGAVEEVINITAEAVARDRIQKLLDNTDEVKIIDTVAGNTLKILFEYFDEKVNQNEGTS